MRRVRIGALALALVGLASYVGPGSHASSPNSLVWSEDFSGAAGARPDAATWNIETGGQGWGNHELQSYTNRPSNVSLDGLGHLRLTSRFEPYTGADHIPRQWTSGRVSTYGKHAFTYGRIEVRANVPGGAGLWPAAWTMGTNRAAVGWPACGEIDIMETKNTGDLAAQSLHGPTVSGSNWTLSNSSSSWATYAGTFHVYEANWSPGRVEFSVDGRTTRVLTRASLPASDIWTLDASQYLLLNLAVGGDYPGPPGPTTPKVSSLLVDWVKVYDNGSV